MPISPLPELEPDFICDCKEWMRSACAGEPFYKEHEGKRYCVLHLPGKRWEPRLASESDVATAQRDVVGAPLKFSRALIYSAAVMAFQRPEPRPATTAAQTIVLLETILGPVQAALLALAIRRKFMR